jgi:hypothetical protein
MVELLNGSRGAPMAGWVIARAGGAILIGVPKRGANLGGANALGMPATLGESRGPILGMKPVYEFMVTTARQPDGTISGSRWDIVPVMFFHAVDEIEFSVPPDFIIECGHFSHKTQTRLRGMVAQGEEVRQHLRRLDSDIAQVGALPPGIPPPPGRLG